MQGGPIVADSGSQSLDPRERPAAVAVADDKGDGSVAQMPPRMRVATATATGMVPRQRPHVVAASLGGADPIGDTIAALTTKTAVAPAKTQVQVASASAEPPAEGDSDAGDPKPLDAKDAKVMSWLGGNASQAWGIQIGAFAAMESAAARLSAAAALAPDHLAKASPAILPSSTGNSTLYRARFGPFDQNEANAACAELNQRGISCQTVHDTN